MRLLIGYDGSESADAALSDLRHAGLPGDAEALILSVVDVMRMPALSSYELVGKHSFPVKKGEPQRVLVEEARKWKADSIFVGSRNISGAFERFRLGSVSTALVTSASCSVEVVR